MSDILERLRNYIPGENAEAVPDRIREAADEIERLEFEFERSDQSAKRLGAKWKEAADEIDRLRNQLDQAKAAQLAAFIAGYEEFPGPTGSWDRAKISKQAKMYGERYLAAQSGDSGS